MTTLSGLSRSLSHAISTPRLVNLWKTQCGVFGTIFNPDRLRLGNKILRQRLKGPSLAAYYPRRIATLKHLRKEYPDYELMDDDEDDRLESVQITKSRGKGAPKKKRTKDTTLKKKKR